MKPAQPRRSTINGWMTCLSLIFLCCVAAGLLALGALIASIFAAVHTDHVLEWHKCDRCGPSNNPCVQGLKHDLHGCQSFHKPTGTSCDSVCYRPENTTNSSRDTHICINTHDGHKGTHMCVGSECQGTCNTVNDCPDLTEITVDFDNTTIFGPLEFGFNKSCELNMCVYEFDVALIPGFGNTTTGCSDDPFYHKQCAGIIDPAEPFRDCLESTAVCRTSGIDADDTFAVDACYFTFKCARAPGLPQFNIDGLFFFDDDDGFDGLL